MFEEAPKKVYSSMKGENAGPVKDTPRSHGVKEFWGTLWGTSVEHNADAPWITTLRDEYFMNVEQKQYEITDETLNKILSRMANNKPGRDLVCGVWIKRIKVYTNHSNNNLQECY